MKRNIAYNNKLIKIYKTIYHKELINKVNKIKLIKK